MGGTANIVHKITLRDDLSRDFDVQNSPNSPSQTSLRKSSFFGRGGGGESRTMMSSPTGFDVQKTGESGSSRKAKKVKKKKMQPKPPPPTEVEQFQQELEADQDGDQEGG